MCYGQILKPSGLYLQAFLFNKKTFLTALFMLYFFVLSCSILVSCTLIASILVYLKNHTGKLGVFQAPLLFGSTAFNKILHFFQAPLLFGSSQCQM